MRKTLALTFSTLSTISLLTQAIAQDASLKLPSDPLKFGVFVVQFDPAGTFKLQGDRWPTMNGHWKASSNEIELTMSGGPGGCDGPGKYRVKTEGNHVGFDLVSDECQLRRMIIDRSTWSPVTEIKTKPTRNITRTA